MLRTGCRANTLKDFHVGLEPASYGGGVAYFVHAALPERMTIDPPQKPGDANIIGSDEFLDAIEHAEFYQSAEQFSGYLINRRKPVAAGKASQSRSNSGTRTGFDVSLVSSTCNFR